MNRTPHEPPWAEWRFVQDVVPTDENRWIHLHNLAIAELLFDARNLYVAERVGISWDGLREAGRTLVLRRLEIDFEQEVPSGTALKVGVRAVTRTRRTVTFDEAVWRVDPPTAVALARSVHLVVRRDRPGAIDLPEDIAGRFEHFEGRPLRWPAT